MLAQRKEQKMADPPNVKYFRKIPYKQDMPPPGGYPKFAYTSKLPKRGPSGVMIMASGVATMAIGFYFVAKGNQKRR